MFEPSDSPRFFGVSPGIDFAEALVKGLCDRFKDRPPEEMGRVELYVNTRRMARRIRSIFDAGPSSILPKIKLITDVAKDHSALAIPPAVPPLRRRLELVQLLSGLLEAQPDLAPRANLFDLADSLMKLMEEMQGEGVSPRKIRELDISDQSGHWERALAFIDIVQRYFGNTDDAPDVEARQRQVVELLAKKWAVAPITNPVIVAGSTGSRGATALFMQAVARLPQGAVVLPGFDFAMPTECWGDLDDALTSEDHPQFRFRKLLDSCDSHMDTVKPWTKQQPANAHRNALVSLALRPAPVTDQWLRDGSKLSDLDKACANLTLVEADSPRTEALAIALKLREAAETGQVAALITPDRVLTRQVTAALQRWKIVPDDSAGTPLQLTPSGRFLRHVASLVGRRLTAASLLTVLKHPLAHSSERGQHQLWTQELEISLRKNGPPFPTRDSVLAWASEQETLTQEATRWTNWIFDAVEPLAKISNASLSSILDSHIQASNLLSAGPDGESAIWEKEAGVEAKRITDGLRQEAHLGGELSAADYQSLFGSVLSQGEVRSAIAVHPNILIWGTLEARVQGADLVILAGLNEGTWPEKPDPDPWMNRTMRQKAGLLLPERRIGLAAHDFQQAIAAPKVWLTRSSKSDDAETVPSRWINRLVNLLGGLEQQGGADALEAMRDRGQYWLSLASELERPVGQPQPSPRPSPRPPVRSRPSQLSVTAIKTLVRDPYAIYARNVLGLKHLDPLVKKPDAPLRGTLVHEILEAFVQENLAVSEGDAKQRLLEIADTILAEKAPWPTARALWKSKVGRFADWFIAQEKTRSETMRPAAFETEAAVDIPELGFRLTAKADRIDIDDQGRLHIFDYKTGAPPSKKVQVAFDKQLLLEAAMAEMGGFHELGAKSVADARFIGLGASPKEVPAPLNEISAEQTWDGLKTLISAYLDPDKGYTSRRAMQKEADEGNYDHLARYGEWDISDTPTPEDLEK